MSPINTSILSINRYLSNPKDTKILKKIYSPIYTHIHTHSHLGLNVMYIDINTPFMSHFFIAPHSVRQQKIPKKKLCRTRFFVPQGEEITSIWRVWKNENFMMR